MTSSAPMCEPVLRFRLLSRTHGYVPDDTSSTFEYVILPEKFPAPLSDLQPLSFHATQFGVSNPIRLGSETFNKQALYSGDNVSLHWDLRRSVSGTIGRPIRQACRRRRKTLRVGGYSGPGESSLSCRAPYAANSGIGMDISTQHHHSLYKAFKKVPRRADSFRRLYVDLNESGPVPPFLQKMFYGHFYYLTW